jgi:hypothetical protein
LPPLDGSRGGGGFGFDFGGGVETFDFAFDDVGGERDAVDAARPRTTRGTRGVRASVLSDDPYPPPRVSVSSSRGEEMQMPRGEEAPDASSSMLEQEVRVRMHARDELRDRRRDASALVSQLRRTPAASPARGALDRAYRAVLAECAELEASVEAMGTGAPSRSRLGAAARTASSASSDGTGAGTSMDARLVDAGSRAAGMLERAEAMRREMREVSASASRGDDAAPAVASPATETDWNAGLGLARNEAPRADVPEPAAEVSGSASAPPAETNWGAGLGLGRKKQ